MRITLEPTKEGLTQNAETCSPKVIIEIPTDDANCGEVIQNLIAPALKAWGFHGDTVNNSLAL